MIEIFRPLTNGLIISPAIREFVLDPPSQQRAMTRRGLPTPLAMISESGTQFRAGRFLISHTSEVVWPRDANSLPAAVNASDKMSSALKWSVVRVCR